MRKIRIICLLLFASLLPFIALADHVQYLKLMVNGSPVIISLADNPHITMTNDVLHITTDAETVDVPVQTVSSMDYIDEATLTAVSSPHSAPIVTSGVIRFIGQKSGTTVAVYAADG